MILPAQHIRQLALEKGMIVPFTERGNYLGKTFGLGPCTYDMRCAQHLIILPWRLWYVHKFYKAIDWVLEKLKLPTRYDHIKLGFTLASSSERVKMPDDISAVVMDKSSWARKGMSVFNTHFDPGFEGYPTLELANNGPDILEIPVGMPVCQFKFERLIEHTEIPYRGKYQNQPSEPVAAREGAGEWAAAA